MAAPLALLVATRDRAELLRRMLASAGARAGAGADALELVVADDGSTDATPAVVAAAAAERPWIRHLRLPAGGKTRALNRAVRATGAPLVACVDDDVELDPGWLAAVRAYFARPDAPAAAQGTIRIAPAAAADPALAAAVDRWRTVPRCDLGPGAVESRSLVGANILLTRAILARVGLFDERLGPGAAGTSEDTELARRILGAGARIGYLRDAIVYHAVDPARLTPSYFRELHESRGRSRLVYKRYGLASHILPNLGRAALGVASGALTGSARGRLRALGRWYHYRAILRERHAPPPPGGVPSLDGP
jgi:GT2 family glycosyltransferase